jgi:hypothetical protein
MNKIFFLLWLASVTAYADPTQNYEEADKEVGCNSPYTKAKQADLFNGAYKDKTFQWVGEIVAISPAQVSLNMDGKVGVNLRASFSDSKAGYDLKKGDSITLQFVMKNVGNCFVPFIGTNAQLLPNTPPFYEQWLSYIGL